MFEESIYYFAVNIFDNFSANKSLKCVFVEVGVWFGDDIQAWQAEDWFVLQRLWPAVCFQAAGDWIPAGLISLEIPDGLWSLQTKSIL